MMKNFECHSHFDKSDLYDWSWNGYKSSFCSEIKELLFHTPNVRNRIFCFPFFPFLPPLSLHSALFSPLGLLLFLSSPSFFCPPDCEPKGHLSPESPVYLNGSPLFDIHLLVDRRRKRKNKFSHSWLGRPGCSKNPFQAPRNKMSVFCGKL